MSLSFILNSLLKYIESYLNSHQWNIVFVVILLTEHLSIAYISIWRKKLLLTHFPKLSVL